MATTYSNPGKKNEGLIRGNINEDRDVSMDMGEFKESTEGGDWFAE